MSYATVDIHVKDTTVNEDPIEGAVVKVLSQDGVTSVTQGVTDSNGVASFLLPDNTIYQVRFYKQQVNFKQPQLIEVEPDTNSFDVFGELFNPPTVTDQRLCVAYGYFRTLTGGPAANVEVIIISRFDPVWLEGASILTERQSFRTNAQGYLQIPLIRFGQYDVTVTGYENYTRTIYVPDALNVNINDLLFPIVQEILFDIPGPYTISVGQDLVLHPIVVISDGREIVGPDTGDVKWRSSDDTILGVIPCPDTLILRGIAPGSAEATAERWDTSIIHIPDSGIEGVPLSVTVIP